jgi:hypothetical protein
MIVSITQVRKRQYALYLISFQVSNGRGYIMKPAQNEIKVYQQSLASLSHMNISDQKAFWCA